MFRFQSISSSSSGNSYYIMTEAGALLIDAGVPIRQFRKLTREYGLSLGKVAGVLVTHHHIDHTRALGILNQKDNIQVYMTEKTKQAIDCNLALKKKPLTDRTTFIRDGEIFRLAGMEITPFEVPHDSSDNSGFLIQHGETRFCIVTDCGHWTDVTEQYVSQATHLVLESNYDPQMLAEGPYPPRLQQRIRGGNGHFSNPQAAEVIARHSSHLKNVWLCHLSEHNNRPELALQTAQGALGSDTVAIVALERKQPSRLYDL
ncbi:MAG: MBL fold metallo-hydrolase [Bacteroidaceae bacterium]|nr:MBL fold metallo-hydrolase [Bacteroidaceae bacterium]MBR4783531.1 MBL fold metallo-hydrolase [Bacteroidaceae bacterium]